MSLKFVQKVRSLSETIFGCLGPAYLWNIVFVEAAAASKQVGYVLPLATFVETLAVVEHVKAFLLDKTLDACRCIKLVFA